MSFKRRGTTRDNLDSSRHKESLKRHTYKKGAREERSNRLASKRKEKDRKEKGIEQGGKDIEEREAMKGSSGCTSGKHHQLEHPMMEDVTNSTSVGAAQE